MSPDTGHHSETGASHSGENAEAGPSKKKRRTNIARACRGCKASRRKCDGQPICSTCQHRGQACVYDGAQDGRTPATKQYIAALENTVRQLKEQVASLQSQSTISLQSELSPEAVATPKPRHRKGDIRITESGAFALYGPTSAWLQSKDAPALPNEHESSATPSADLRIHNVDLHLGADWAKDIAPGTISSPSLHKTILSVFFSYYNGWCDWCNETAFLTDMVASSHSLDGPKRTPHYSPFLHNVILALTLLGAPHIISSGDESQWALTALLEHARNMVESEISLPISTSVRGFLILGLCHFYLMNKNVGWLYGSIGIQIAQILGLNTDAKGLVERQAISTQTKARRDHTFWAVMAQNIGWSFQVGRTLLLHPEDHETPLPLISEAEDQEPWYDHRERLSPTIFRSVRPAWSSSTFHWLGRLCQVGQYVHRAMYSVWQPAQSVRVQSVARIELDFATWFFNLPTPLRVETWVGDVMPPHLVVLHAVYHYWRILLHRPIIFDMDIEADSRESSLKACKESASAIINLLEIYPCQESIIYTMISVTFTAGTTWLLFSANAETTKIPSHQSIIHVGTCIQFLEKTAWPVGVKAGQILHNLRSEWQPGHNNAAVRPQYEGGFVDQPAYAAHQGLGNTMEALKDPNHDLVRLLRSLGWAPPPNLSPVPTSIVPPRDDPTGSSDTDLFSARSEELGPHWDDAVMQSLFSDLFR